MKRSTAALLAAALLGSVSSAPALAGPDSTSIRPPPVGSAPLRASSAARADTSDVSARALLLDSNATIDGSRVTGAVSNALNANYLEQGGSYVEANKLNVLTATTANGALWAGKASQADTVYNVQSGTYVFSNDLTVKHSHTVDRQYWIGYEMTGGCQMNGQKQFIWGSIATPSGWAYLCGNQ